MADSLSSVQVARFAVCNCCSNPVIITGKGRCTRTSCSKESGQAIIDSLLRNEHIDTIEAGILTRQLAAFNLPERILPFELFMSDERDASSCAEEPSDDHPSIVM